MEGVVHIVDDDAAMRESVAFLLESDGLRSFGYESALALLSRANELEAGCILTDIRMPEMNGLELVAELKSRGVPHPVVVLTGHADVGLAVQSMKAGVVDFLEKPFANDTLLKTVRDALAAAEDSVGRARERAAFAERAALLSAREREVFEAVAAGLSNKAVALKLGISPRTVEIYRANVMTKMQANSLSELVRMGLELGGTAAG